MNIFRITVESLKTDDPTATQAELDALRARIRSLPGMILYPADHTPEDTWGLALRPDTVQLDVDLDKPDADTGPSESAVDNSALDLIREFLDH